MKQAKKQKEVVHEEEETAIGEAHYEEEEQAFTEIDALQEHGINMADIQKLKQAGLSTILSILMW
jgi:hypothetical protein